MLIERKLDGCVFVVIIAGEDVNITAAASTAQDPGLLPHLEAVDHRAAHLHLRLHLPGETELLEGPAPARHHHVVVVELDDLHLAVPGRERSGQLRSRGRGGLPADPTRAWWGPFRFLLQI